MSCGPLPPVPDLIPIAALRRNTSSESKNLEYTPFNTDTEEVMGEQRSRRTVKQPAIDLIDTSRSRGFTSAAPQASTRRTRPERHRKSDRRRDHKSGRKRSKSKQNPSSQTTFSERPINPRVNPIFVWVRQEDNRIVDVKCEDYDKRNRILLTKTAQGWRAIPRTETLVPSLKEAADKHRHHKSRKSAKVKRKSTGIQVNEDMQDNEDALRFNFATSPSWSSPVNIESHLPSHTIHVTRKRPLTPDVQNVNSVVNLSAQDQNEECSVTKVCDVTPLDNLLAVAELEFNHQIQSGQWSKSCDSDKSKNDDIILESISEETKTEKEYIEEISQLGNLIETCEDSKNNATAVNAYTEPLSQELHKSEDCDYNEEDDNNIAMDDILSRLEQSLQSPDAVGSEIQEITDDCIQLDTALTQDKEENYAHDETQESVPDNTETLYEENKQCDSDILELNNEEQYVQTDEPIPVIGSSTTEGTELQDQPTDLTVKNKRISIGEDIEPTDLSIPKAKIVSQFVPPSPRPPSQNSETIQSPEPSGIPAVPPSPDHSTANTSNKQKSVYLESLLLTSPTQKLIISTELTNEKEILDLGKSRESASPTVTCSEEVKKSNCSSTDEPLTKKCKLDDSSLKSLLNSTRPSKSEPQERPLVSKEQKVTSETPKLLELLTIESECEPIVQLKKLLSNSSLKIPDPMLVPKDKLSQIISSPGEEIPRLLMERPELRLPEALAFPHLLQDPDILVITLKQLEIIIQKQSQPLPIDNFKAEEIQKQGATCTQKEKVENKVEDIKINRKYDSAKTKLCLQPSKDEHKHSAVSKPKEPRNANSKISELASDIDAATTAAFNQMMWLPYINQLEAAAMAFGNNADFLKIINNIVPPYSNQVPEFMPPMMNINKFTSATSNFPTSQQLNYNPREFSLWQEAMMQASLLKQRNTYDMMNVKNVYRDLPLINTQKKVSLSNNKHSKTKPAVNNYFSSSASNPHESYLNANSYVNSSKQSLQIPQYNPLLSQKHQLRNVNPNSMGRGFWETRGQSKLPMNNLLSLQNDEKRLNSSHHLNNESGGNSCTPKLICKSLANLTYDKYQDNQKKAIETPKQTSTQPIDLSGNSMPNGRLNKKEQFAEPTSAAKLFKHDEIPEVGSTTASIEEMQDAQKHLWHPLFGNQKNYNSPWNWSTVTATGE